MTSTHADLQVLRDAGYVERRPLDHTIYVLIPLGETHLATVPPKPLFVGSTVRGNYRAPGPGRMARAAGIPWANGPGCGNSWRTSETTSRNTSLRASKPTSCAPLFFQQSDWRSPPAK